MIDRRNELQQELARTQGELIVISGPSAAAGKGEVISLLLPRDERYWLSVSKTTRPKRSDDHHNYDHVTDEVFDHLDGTGQLLEAGGRTEKYRYGTPLAPIIERLRNNQNVILELDINGARAVRRLYPGGLRLFIKPTHGDVKEDLAELNRRLHKRGTNSPESIVRRLHQAEEELYEALEAGDLYDRWIVNATDHASAAAEEIHQLIQARLALRTDHHLGASH